MDTVIAVLVRAVVIGLVVPIVNVTIPITMLPFYLVAAIAFGWALVDARSHSPRLLLRWVLVAVGAAAVAMAAMRIVTMLRDIDGGALRYDLILYGYGAVVFVLIPAVIGLGLGRLLRSGAHQESGPAT